MKICLIGASFETANLGVSALADSAISGIVSMNPSAEVFILDYAHEKKNYRYKHKDNFLTIPLVNIRFSKKIYLPNNVAFLIACSLLNKCTFGLLCGAFKKNNVFKMLLSTDVFVAITAGDSFSDIYGKRSFFYVGLPIYLVSLFKKKLVYLPQTYGPFKSKVSEWWARILLKKADYIYSRDYKSIPAIKKIVPFKSDSVEFCYDVAFGLPVEIPSNTMALSKRNGKSVVGFNVSGLLYMGGYTKDNMFGLKMKYGDLVVRIIEKLLFLDVDILLIPHVTGCDSVENDTDACKEIYEKFDSLDKKNIYVFEHAYNQREIKGAIGQCEFFIGSRMHACIAALSQAIPAVGIAYSRKFIGLYETLHCQDLVLDPRKKEEFSIISSLIQLYKQRKYLSNELKKQIPCIDQKLTVMFKSTATSGDETT